VPERGLPAPQRAAESVVIAPWPNLPAEWIDAATETRIARMQELVRNVREVRNRYMVDPKTPLSVAVRCTEATASDFRALQPFIASLAGVGELTCGPDTTKPRQSATIVQPEFEAYVSLAGLIDVPTEIKRLEKQLADKVKLLQGARAKLGNASFVDKAPPEVVQQQRDLVGDLQNQIQTIENNLKELRASEES
jgi:valyl-tRNA synthetase